MNQEEYKSYLVEIYKVESEKYNKTRDIQWRMNIAVWTVIILAFYAKDKHDINLSGNQFIALVLAAVCLLLHLFFIIGIHTSLNNSLARMHNIAKRLLDAAETELAMG